ncbi:MAG: hypothetical protein ACT4QF_25355 [Sporichthyaceae bacterium]|jgi:hypothetical protein
MSEFTAGPPAPGFAQLGIDAEQVAQNFPRPVPVAPEAWRAAKVSVPEHVEALAEGVGYPS